MKLGSLATLGLLLGSPAISQSNWVGPEPLITAGLTRTPSAARGGPHGIDIVYTNGSGELFWQWPENGGYSVPVLVANVKASSAPAMVAGGRHLLDVFYRGPNGHLWTVWHDGQSWSAPADLGGVKIVGPPAAVANSLHRLDVFYVDEAGKLRTSYWNGGAWWSAPATFTDSVKVNGTVAAVGHGVNRIDVFYREKAGPGRPANEGKLMHFYSNGGPWSGASRKFGLAYASPSGTSFNNPAGGVAVFYHGSFHWLCAIRPYVAPRRAPDAPKKSWSEECTSPKLGGGLVAITPDEIFTTSYPSTIEGVGLTGIARWKRAP